MNPNGTWRPNPYRRAIAMAIEMERMHDAMARIVGHSIPLPDRIVPEGSRQGEPRSLRMRLPGPMTLEAMNDVADARLSAVGDLAGRLRVTDPSTAFLADAMLEEATERTSAEQGFRPPWRRGPSRSIDPDDRMSAEEREMRDIERAADAPPPPAAREIRTPDPEPVVDRESISIDLMTEGLLDHHGVDRVALWRELARHRAGFTSRSATVRLASPAAMSNDTTTLASLGADFPSAKFTLRGVSLVMTRMEMPIDARIDPYSSWRYHGTPHGGEGDMPSLSRDDAMHGYDVFDFPARALRDVTRDPRFHDAIVIQAVDRWGMDGNRPTTSMRLRRGYAHLDPPGAQGVRRTRVTRASDVRRPTQPRALEHRDLAWAGLVDRLLNQAGHRQRRTVRLKEGVGLQLAIADLGGTTLRHKYDITRDTLDDGEEAIAARVASIATMVASWATARPRRHRSAGTVPAPPPVETHVPTPATVAKANPEVEDADPCASSIHPAQDGSVVRAAIPLTPADRFVAAFGDEAAADWTAATRIDALLADVTHGGRAPTEEPNLHVQEGVIAVRTLAVSAEAFYRLEKFDRVMGRPTHAIGTIEVARELPAGMIETLRDGTAKPIANGWPGLASAQVRKVTRCDGVTLVTVRVQLRDRD